MAIRFGRDESLLINAVTANGTGKCAVIIPQAKRLQDEFFGRLEQR